MTVALSEQRPEVLINMPECGERPHSKDGSGPKHYESQGWETLEGKPNSYAQGRNNKETRKDLLSAD